MSYIVEENDQVNEIAGDEKTEKIKKEKI